MDDALELSPAKNGDAVQIICYAIPGLGATGEIFEKLQLPPGIALRPLNWENERKDETLADYARRLVAQIDQSRPFLLAGFSFGAVIAIEIAKITNPLLVVIVSGVTQGDEIPFYLKYLRAFHAYKLAPVITYIPVSLVRLGCRIAFGTKDPHALDLLVLMVLKQSPSFYIWGLEAMMAWKNDWVPECLLHIHGSADRLLPIHYVEPDITIRGGGHFILYTHGAEIAQMIMTALESCQNAKPTPSRPLAL